MHFHDFCMFPHDITLFSISIDQRSTCLRSQLFAAEFGVNVFTISSIDMLFSALSCKTSPSTIRLPNVSARWRGWNHTAHASPLRPGREIRLGLTSGVDSQTPAANSVCAVQHVVSRRLDRCLGTCLMSKQIGREPYCVA